MDEGNAEFSANGVGTDNWLGPITVPSSVCTLKFCYDSYTVPDQFILRFNSKNGKVAYDSGMLGTKGEVCVDIEKPFGVNKVWILQQSDNPKTTGWECALSWDCEGDETHSCVDPCFCADPSGEVWVDVCLLRLREWIAILWIFLVRFLTASPLIAKILL